MCTQPPPGPRPRHLLAAPSPALAHKVLLLQRRDGLARGAEPALQLALPLPLRRAGPRRPRLADSRDAGVPRWALRVAGLTRGWFVGWLTGRLAEGVERHRERRVREEGRVILQPVQHASAPPATPPPGPQWPGAAPRRPSTRRGPGRARARFRARAPSHPRARARSAAAPRGLPPAVRPPAHPPRRRAARGCNRPAAHRPTARSGGVRGRAACPVSTRGGTRLVRLVRGRRGGCAGARGGARRLEGLELGAELVDERLLVERLVRDAACPISTG